MQTQSKVLVALSGGVDSALAAYRLREQGHCVEGAYIRTWLNESEIGDCPAAQDIEDAEKVADHLGIPFRVINLVEDYRELVVRYLVDGYRHGHTPNPDIMCNRLMKFGVFRELAKREGFTAIATGHYCRRTHGNSWNILEGVDKNKDQSYFLALTHREALAEALFPIGELSKPEVRLLARQAGLPNAAKKDSQGICFLGKVRINEFLAEYIPDCAGEIVTVDGRTVGSHSGLHRFTIGQRKGIGVPSNTDFEAFVVVAKDYDRNHLVVGFDRPETPGLYHSAARVENLNWLENWQEGETLTAKPRYRDPHQAVELRWSNTQKTAIDLRFAVPQRALACGQIVAFYRGEVLMGGGVYTHITATL